MNQDILLYHCKNLLNKIKIYQKTAKQKRKSKNTFPEYRDFNVKKDEFKFEYIKKKKNYTECLVSNREQ